MGWFQADCTAGDSWVRKTLSGAVGNGFTVDMDVFLSSDTLLAVATPQYTANWLEVAVGGTPFGWLGAQTVDAGATAQLLLNGNALSAFTLPLDVSFHILYQAVWNGGASMFDVTVKVNGVTADTYQQGSVNTASLRQYVELGGISAEAVAGELYWFDNFIMKDSAASTLWSDDFEGSLSWNFNSGSPSIVSAPTPGAAAGGTPHGVCVAFGDDALAVSPTYTSIDDPTGIDVVTGWSTKRGRTYMTDRTEAGTASVDFVDTAGVMDPTNSTGPFYPMDPNCPFKIELFHPIDEDWHVIYTGLVQNMPQRVDLSENFIRGTLNAADLFSLLAIDEIPPGLNFDDSALGTNTANAIGDTTYAAQQVQDRIKAILADAEIDAAQTDIFSGNVDLQFTTYPPGTQVLTALQDAADAEFPTVANLYCDKDNKIVFHGRLARFDPTGTAVGTDWVYTEWNVGDIAAATLNPTWAVISGLQFDRDVSKVINAALVSPDGIADADIAAQLSTDSGSITQYGNRVYTAQNLLTLDGTDDGLDANEETKLFGDYLSANFHDAQNQISQLTFQGVPAGSPYAGPVWDILCGVDIGDRVNVTTTHPGGGGFSAAPYYVEGISYEATVRGGANFQDVTMTLDLSPVAYFTTNPFS